MAGYGFDERGSSILLGHAMEYDIVNLVDPHFTVVAKGGSIPTGLTVPQ